MQIMLQILLAFTSVAALHGIEPVLASEGDGCTCGNQITCDGQKNLTTFPPSLLNETFCPQANTLTIEYYLL